MLVGTFACGTVFALVAGQPLLIMGGTGPVLVFEVGLYEVYHLEMFLLVYNYIEQFISN